MATDLAEFLGGAIGLSLLFHLPLFWGMVVTGIVTYGILLFEQHGFRPIELIIGGLVAVIGLCYLAEMFIAPVDWGAAACTSCAADAGREALTIAVGIIGATVMPHAIYLHSGLTQARAPGATTASAKAAALFQPGSRDRACARRAGQHGDGDDGVRRFPRGPPRVAEIETAYHTLTPLLGAGAAASSWCR